MTDVTARTRKPTALTDVHRVLVIGLGASGLAAARLLVAHGVEVTLVDDVVEHPAARAATAEGLRVVLGHRPVEVLDEGMDLVVPSPGVPEGAPVLRAAADAGIPVWSEPELGLRIHPRRLVAVTGTNGKTSTTELLAAMLAAGDLPVAACGNIGRPVSEAAATTAPDTVLVAELSSFQLRFAHTLRASVGVLLNVADDHLDWHGDTAAYRSAKARIWVGQEADDWAVANADDPISVALRDAHAPGRPAAFSATSLVPVGVGHEGSWLVDADPHGRSRRLLAVDELTSGARHHVANVAAAATVALCAGVAPEAVAGAARGYHAGAHRFQTVAVIDEVTYVNDSKATNVHAAAAALDGADEVIWIAGGLSKGVDLSPLSAHLGGVRAAVLLGAATDELASICAAADVPWSAAVSMDAAVATASRLATPGGTVLLAPACASFDQFRDYADRGDRFAAAVRSLTTTQDGSA